MLPGDRFDCRPGMQGPGLIEFPPGALAGITLVGITYTESVESLSGAVCTDHPYTHPTGFFGSSGSDFVGQDYRLLRMRA